MKYNIISINDTRAEYKANIRANTALEEVRIPSVNGHDVDIDKEFAARGLGERGWSAKIGEAGCWLSHFDCWKWASDNDESLIVFEDDAVVSYEFDRRLSLFSDSLPDDADFFSLWVPDNQRQDYWYKVTYDNVGNPDITGRVNSSEESHFYVGSRFVARAYQGYGLVATYYTPAGARKLIKSAYDRGVCTPVDCFIFQESHAERVKGYAPRPPHSLVGYDWSAQTTIHNTGERIAL